MKLEKTKSFKRNEFKFIAILEIILIYPTIPNQLYINQLHFAIYAI